MIDKWHNQAKINKWHTRLMVVSAFKLIHDTGMKWFCTLLQYKILHNLKKQKQKNKKKIKKWSSDMISDCFKVNQ